MRTELSDLDRRREPSDCRDVAFETGLCQEALDEKDRVADCLAEMIVVRNPDLAEARRPWSAFHDSGEKRQKEQSLGGLARDKVSGVWDSVCPRRSDPAAAPSAFQHSLINVVTFFSQRLPEPTCERRT